MKNPISNVEEYKFFTVASGGTSEALGKELKTLGFKGIKIHSGGVEFKGFIRDGWRACLYSRVAQRIQLELGGFEVLDEEDIYQDVRSIEWYKYLTPDRTLCVKAFCAESQLHHSGYLALKVKDAIVDTLRNFYGVRPNVDRDDADLCVFVHLFKNRLKIYLDMSGGGLALRGYRLEAGEAPLRETVAAAMLIYSGWDKKEKLWDPMCGSGTIVIEAAIMAADIAPGILRDKFGFERWANFTKEDHEVMKQLRGEARHRASGNVRIAHILGSDSDSKVLELARENAKRAGVKITFKCARLEAFGFDGEKRLILMNPPYDLRLGADRELYRKISSFLSKQHGCRAGVLCGNPELLKQISLKSSVDYKIHNGGIECVFRIYDIP